MATLKVPGFKERLGGLWAAHQRAHPEKPQRAFAAEHSIDQQSFSEYLRGGTPTFENLERLAIAFEVSWQWLLVGDEGIKAMGAISPRDPIVIRTDDRHFAIASWSETDPTGVSIYEVTHPGIRNKSTAVRLAKTVKDEQKL